MPSIVEFQDVTRLYGKVLALNDLTLAVPEGSICALVGRNGAGKTTMLRMIPALIHPTTGTVRVFGLDPWQSQQEVKLHLGYLSESEEWPPLVRVEDLTGLCASVYPTWDAAMASRLLDQFSINPRSRMVALSKGQKRQVGLMCAVCHRPKLLVLDEPGGGLDPAARRSFLDVVIRLLVDSGTTVLFSSHIMSDLDRVADRIAILHRGRLLLHTQLDELKENTCRVEISGDLPPDAGDAIASHPLALNARAQNGSMRVTLKCPPDVAPRLLADALRSAPAARLTNVVAMSLEDIFIELTEDRP